LGAAAGSKCTLVEHSYSFSLSRHSMKPESIFYSKWRCKNFHYQNLFCFYSQLSEEGQIVRRYCDFLIWQTFQQELNVMLQPLCWVALSHLKRESNRRPSADSHRESPPDQVHSTIAVTNSALHVAQSRRHSYGSKRSNLSMRANAKFSFPVNECKRTSFI